MTKNNTEKQTEQLIKKIDFTKLHIEMVFSGYNDNVIIWMDGSISTLSSSTWPNTEENYILLKAWGLGNINSLDYAEGFYVQSEKEDGVFLNPETKKELTLEEMIAECIEEGEWSTFQEDMETQISEQIEDFLNQ